MFQHLDSGARPPDPSDLRFDVERRACALRQRRRLVATTALSMCLLLPAAIGYVGWRSVQPTRVHVFDELPTSEPATSGTASSALTTATPATPSTTAVDAPVTLLVVGTDRGLAPGGDASTNADTRVPRAAAPSRSNWHAAAHHAQLLRGP